MEEYKIYKRKLEDKALKVAEKVYGALKTGFQEIGKKHRSKKGKAGIRTMNSGAKPDIAKLIKIMRKAATMKSAAVAFRVLKSGVSKWTIRLLLNVL